MRTVTRLVMAAATVVGYVALMLAISAGIDQRERTAFDDASAQQAAFLAALDRGSAPDARAVSDWFRDHAPSRSRSRASISLGTDAAEAGDFDLARRFAGDVPAKIEEDRTTLTQDAANAWTRATPWLVTGAVLGAAALTLRHRRKAANAEVVELVDQFVPPRPRWRRPVFMMVTAIGYTLLIAGFMAVVAVTRTMEIPWDVKGFMLIGGVIAIASAYYVLRYSRPRSAKAAAQVLQAEWRKPVLYLRAFDDDQHAAVVDGILGSLASGLLTIHSREEQLVGALGAFGPVIAVGRPGEPLPQLGAARFYLPFDDWQPGVLRLMELSQLIVLRLGEGEGLRWEIEQARATQPPGKLMLLVPSKHMWTSEVVVFDRDWQERVQRVGPFAGEKKRYGAPVFYVARAMQAALESVGTRRRAMGMRINSKMLAVFGKVLLLFPALVLIIFLLRLIFMW
ncbi:hypothetical protein ACIA8G_02620 [Lentzea sp. NPDC051213]|uniref:hypothetical protein n=1 Tax=Lentzea sp. NPDC051213 TaxID=3364126 RepID=UPI0037AD3D81